ncbi:MAG: hypothetical protein COB07_04085 [Sulfurovum sp.]|nr:MAG: hypothetical protein COB07_04085 [Sulfurovum sp.]
MKSMTIIVVLKNSSILFYLFFQLLYSEYRAKEVKYNIFCINIALFLCIDLWSISLDNPMSCRAQQEGL